MSNKDWNDRHQKFFARNYAMTGSYLGDVKRKPFNNVLCLPGFDPGEKQTAICMSQGINSGYINPSSTIIGVERDKQTYKNIIYGSKPKETIRNSNFWVSDGKLEDFDPNDFQKGFKFDLCFLDLMGCWSAELSNWLTNMAENNLKNDAVLGLTIYRFPRITPRCYEYFEEQLSSPTNQNFLYWIKEELNPKITRGSHFYHEGKLWNKTSMIKQMNDIVPIAMICNALLKANKSFTLHGAYCYADQPTAQMTSIHISRIRSMNKSHELSEINPVS